MALARAPHPSRAGGSLGAWLDLGYQPSARYQGPGVGTEVQAASGRAGVSWELERTVRLRFALGAGADRYHYQPHGDSAQVALAAPGSFYVPVLAGFVALDLPLGGHLALTLRFSADVPLAKVHFDLRDRDGQATRLLSPYPVIPAASLGLAFALLGTSLGQGSGGTLSPATGGISGGGGSGGNTSAMGGATLTTKAAGGTTGTAGQGDASTGGASGAGGQGGTSTPNDAGTSSSDAPSTTCANRGESCSSTRACCGPLVCLGFGGPSTCYESMPPPPDTSVSSEVARDMDTGCPVCPSMKCCNTCPTGTCP